ncbi:MAG: CPBP family intramembrane metalloprotease [Phycisphaerales bacterium]|nr:CPBP family intramembrane metalloprotease [Phycisphaerales bacterium]
MTLFGPHIDLPPSPLPVAERAWWRPVMRRRLAAPPRVWTVFVVYLLALLFSVGLSAIVAAAYLLATDGFSAGAEGLASMARTVTGMVLMILPSQLAFGGVAIAAACVSPAGFRERIGLTRVRLPLWVVLVFFLTTAAPLGVHLMAAPFIQQVTAAAAQDAESPFLAPMEVIGDMATAGEGWWHTLIVLGLLSVVPGVLEELLFRGYILRGLLRRVHPVPAVIITALLFSIAHLNPIQAVGVLPLGIFVGFVTWRCGSVIPAMVIHTLNNLAITGTRRATADMDLAGGDLTGLFVVCGLALLGVGLLAFLGSIVLLVTRGSPRPDPPIAFAGPRGDAAFPRRIRPAVIRLTVRPARPLPVVRPPWDAGPSHGT